MTEPQSTINDPRVVASEGGGYAPEQHFGELADGRIFYFRMRGGACQLHLGQPGEVLPVVNPLWVKEEFDAAYDAGQTYPHLFFRPPIGAVDVYPDDPFLGCFKTQEDRDRAFTACLDQIEEEQ